MGDLTNRILGIKMIGQSEKSVMPPTKLLTDYSDLKRMLVSRGRCLCENNHWPRTLA